MRSQLICLLALCAASVVLGEQFSFEGYKVWNVIAKTEEQRDALLSWEDNENVDFWETLSRSDKPVRIMIAPSTQDSFVNFLESAGIENELIIHNVEAIFEEERRVDAEYREKAKNQPIGPRFIPDFNHFWTRNEINNYLTHLLAFHGDIVSTEVAGFSFQGQMMRSITISRHGGGRIDGSRPVVFIDVGIHAREWAVHTTTMYFLYQLVELRNQNLDILDHVDFVILPIVNPDGYDYSRLNYRLWRKTRRPVTHPVTGQACFGIDGNRNYEHVWRSGNNPCGDTYPGTAPFSEPETQAVRDILARYGTDIKVYVSMHSCGSYVLYPWGYEPTLIDNWQLHDDMGRIFADAILESTGRNYTVGNGAIALYPAFGASDDYAAAVGAETSFTFELPCGGPNGFDLPASQINAVAIETWTGFREFLRFTATHEWSDDHVVVFPILPTTPEPSN